MRVIVLEGVNGAGKSTVAARVQNALRAARLQCLSVDPAGYGAIGELLRKRFVPQGIEFNANLEAVLFAALRMEGGLRILEAARSEPLITVLLERWSLALAAYGTTDGARGELVSELRGMLDSTLAVDVTILLNVDGVVASERIGGNGSMNRFELGGPQYLGEVARWYCHFATQEPDTAIVDASGDVAATFDQVRGVLTATWGELKDIL